jgi:ferredoxin
MLDRVISHSDFIAAVDELARKRRIVGPVAREDRFFYQQVEDSSLLDLSFNYCVYGPRCYLFPPVETLFTFEKSNGNFSATPVIDRRPTAFIGVHPCDIHAIRLLDRVFSMDEPDEHYLARRAATLIVGIDCPRPCMPGVFCVDMQAHEAAEGFDVMLYPLERDGEKITRFGVVFGTQEGRHWLLYSRRCEAPTATDERSFDTYVKAKGQAFVPQLKTSAQDLPALLDRSYDSLLWEATARRCYSCGSCNLSCPTCYCFNIRDELNLDLQTGDRKREWDGCQLRDFAEVAGGHNFRPKAASRLRHRIYRKAKWIRERSGLAGCVGCARCDRACTAKINSVEIYNQLAEESV